MAFLLLIGNSKIGLPKLNMDICNYIDTIIYTNNLKKIINDERVDILEKNQKNKNIYNLDLNQNINNILNIWDYSACKGYLNIIKWLHYNKKEGCSKSTMDFAAMNGHLEVVKWLHYNRTEGCTCAAMNLAALNGNLRIVKFLHENRNEGCSDWVIDNAKTQKMKNYLINNNCLKNN